MLAPPYTGDYGSSLCQVNVAVQGHVRLLNDDARRCDMAKAHCGSIVYVGVWQKFTFRPLTADEENDFTTDYLTASMIVDGVKRDPRSTMHYRFERFSSTMLTAGKYSLGTPANGLENNVVNDNMQCCNPADVDDIFMAADWLGTHALTTATSADDPYTSDLIRSFGTSRTDGPFGFERLIGAYVLGTTADSNQSPNMLTVVVNLGFVDWIGATTEAELARAVREQPDQMILMERGAGVTDTPYTFDSTRIGLCMLPEWRGWQPNILKTNFDPAKNVVVRRKPLDVWFADFKAEVKKEWGVFVATRITDGKRIRVESDDSFFEAGIVFTGRGPVAELLHAQWVAPNDPNEWYRDKK